MRLSSGATERIEGLTMLKHGPDDRDAAACEGDEGPDVPLSLAPLAVVEGLRGRVLGGDGAEGALVEDALEGLVAAVGPAEGPGLAGLAQDGREAGRRREGVGRAEAGDVARRGDELGREDGPHAGHAADEGPVRVAGDERLQL